MRAIQGDNGGGVNVISGRCTGKQFGCRRFAGSVKLEDRAATGLPPPGAGLE
jgi:hypothetical protein